MRTILADVPFLVFLAASTATAIVYFQQEAALPLQVLADGHSTAIYGSLISLNGLVVTAIELPFSSVTRRFPPRRVIAAGSVLLGVGFGATGARHLGAAARGDRGGVDARRDRGRPGLGRVRGRHLATAHARALRRRAGA